VHGLHSMDDSRHMDRLLGRFAEFCLEIDIEFVRTRRLSHRMQSWNHEFPFCLCFG